MPKYCLDTSGLSGPFMDLPEDIYETLWIKVQEKVEAGVFCWNGEIAQELKSIYGGIGACLQKCNGDFCLEIGDSGWPWQDYLVEVERLRVNYRDYISEYNGGRKGTVGFNDLSIVALAKTLKLPVLSMEAENKLQPSKTKIRIPELCAREGVGHLTFNDFLRAEGIKL